MIIINWDFVSGKEVSFIEGMNQVNNFETNVLHFFCWDYLGTKKCGNYLFQQ